MRFKKNFKYFNRDLHSIVPYGLKVENKHSLKSCIEGQICKSILSKMTSTKTNKNKKCTPLPKTNFWSYTTLLFCLKWFLHSKGPKNAICLWLSHDMKQYTFNLQSFLSWLSQRQIAILGPLEWRNHFGQKSKVV